MAEIPSIPTIINTEPVEQILEIITKHLIAMQNELRDFRLEIKGKYDS